jgi:hypothetical protein
MYAVMRYYHHIRSGISFKVNETVIELWQNSYESEDNKSSTTISFCAEEDEDDLGYLNCSHLVDVEDIFECNDDISDKSRNIKQAADEGSDENDSLLVAYDMDSVVSLWHKNIFKYRSLQVVLKAYF